MGTMILISVVAIVVALVGSAVIWRLDIARADEIEHETPASVVAKPAIAAPGTTAGPSLRAVPPARRGLHAVPPAPSSPSVPPSVA